MTTKQLPFPQLLSVYRAAGVTGRTSGTTYTVVFDTKEIDTAGAFNTSTGEWTPPRGVYVLGCSVAFYSDTTCVLTRVAPQVTKNGSLFKWLTQLDMRSGATLPTFWQYYAGASSLLIIASGTDVFRIDVVATTGSGTWSYDGGAALTYLNAFQIA